MDPIERLREREHLAELGGGEERLKKQHAQGKLTARERMTRLFDPGTFEEVDKLVTHRCQDFGMEQQVIPGDGVVSGHGRIHGRVVYAFAQDFTVFGGSLSETNAAKICKVMDMATRNGAPIVGLNDSGGARIQEGVVSLGGYSDIFLRNTLASGVVPQISAIMGPCAGGAVYSPAITDFIVMVKQSSYMFVTGPDVIKTVTHEDVTKEDLGGAMTHNEKSGVAHFAVENDAECIALIRELLSFMPGNNLDDPPRKATDDPLDREDDSLDRLVPASPNQPYDMLDLIHTIADEGYFLEVHQHYARNIIVGFARLGGRPGGHRRQSTGIPGRHARHQRVGQGRAIRAVLRRVQHSVDYVRGCPGIPAGDGAGVRRHHSSRSQAPLCVCGGDGAEDHRDYAQGLRRAPTASWRASTSAPTSTTRGRAPRSRSWARRGRSTSFTSATSRRPPIPRRCALRKSRSSASGLPVPTSPPSAATSTKSSSRA